jgi:hypothetical protein
MEKEEVRIQRVLADGIKLFESLGFVDTLVNDKVNYIYNNEFHMFTYDKGMRMFFLEVAVTLEEAKINYYEDISNYPISLSDEEILLYLKQDIVKYIIEQVDN